MLVRRVLRAHRTARPSSPPSCRRSTPSPRDVGDAPRRRTPPGARRAREVLDVGHLDVTEGLVGDTWVERGSRRTPDGSPHPDMQLNLMNHRLVEFLAQDPDREQLAGDQMFVDLDLVPRATCPPGASSTSAGPTARSSWSPTSRTPGAASSSPASARTRWPSSTGPSGKPRRLRGLCAKVVPSRARSGRATRCASYAHRPSLPTPRWSDASHILDARAAWEHASMTDTRYSRVHHHRRHRPRHHGRRHRRGLRPQRLLASSGSRSATRPSSADASTSSTPPVARSSARR